MILKKWYFAIFILMTTFGLTACGGGGGDGASNTIDDSVTYDITISASPLSFGTVSGGGSFNGNQTVSLTAIPNAGYSFINWTESGTVVSTSSNFNFTASSNRTLVANFSISNYTVSATTSPGGGGAIVGVGNYDHGASVTLTATPNAGYSFTNWTESGSVVSTSSNFTFTVLSNRTLAANFAVINYSVSASSNPVGGASITGAGNYDHGASVTLTATPSAGYSFTNWTESGTVVSTSSSITFTASSNRTLVANLVSHISTLNGVYDGVMKSPLALFGADQSDTTFEVSGTNITITQEHFFGETCIFTGQITNIVFPSAASGTYQCSDFSSGTWSSSVIAKTNKDSFIAELDIDTGGGTYTAKYNGFLPEADVPSQYSFVPGYYFDSGNYLDIIGIYKGDLKSNDSCAAYTFEISSSDTTITISGSDIEITQDSFFEGTCIFTGTISDTGSIPLNASGTYQCSNFDTGTWSSDSIALTGMDSFFAELFVDVPARGCNYNVRYSGFK
jgi:hypothetical protein